MNEHCVHDCSSGNYLLLNLHYLYTVPFETAISRVTFRFHISTFILFIAVLFSSVSFSANAGNFVAQLGAHRQRVEATCCH